MSGRSLSPAAFQFIDLVAARRFGRAGEQEAPAHVPTVDEEDPFLRAAAVAAALLGSSSAQRRPAAFLAMWCQLALDGYELLAPQGVAAGMIARLADDSVQIASVARWLKDRCVPTGSEGQ